MLSLSDKIRQMLLKLSTSILIRESSDSVVECLTQDRGFEPHRRHCIVVFEQDTFILA